MQTVYEIVQDDMVLTLPLFTDLKRAQHELNQIVRQELEIAHHNYPDAHIVSTQSVNPTVEGDIQLIVAANGLLEYTNLAIYRREVNTATLGDSHN